MNELEKEINLGAENCVKEWEKYCSDDESEAIAHDCFKEGCDFILEKNLPVLFAKWLLTVNAVDLQIEGYSAEQLYEYWLENVYGKD